MNKHSKNGKQEAVVVEQPAARPPIHDLVAAIQQEAAARENAAAAEFKVAAAEISQRYGVRMRVGITTWDDGEVTGQVQFVSVGIPQN